ncbi:hypothetical protein TREMEDRAFT_58738 [Tremella mesenterica DSM 1558]|uniref:uncharacterized protein n=1 Tax=Tremella mesenterica (strain ATCC 24925 / CBS 8224 / DSM 1558 / NBRC 9311 / NRRL Y-6157 / RJB 2259-6 / UBC 559-6) TaxID=578456 RepID=UPI0003F496EC|nr:uncharacterized protein TREMEDRAFT_58738 [Tremella mesenterica DSM 1558]EIW72568.1 hypothetical protein TREMEDRAFT_58738 [Tremella mesenterica DSM 1558]
MAGPHVTGPHSRRGHRSSRPSATYRNTTHRIANSSIHTNRAFHEVSPTQDSRTAEALHFILSTIPAQSQTGVREDTVNGILLTIMTQVIEVGSSQMGQPDFSVFDQTQDDETERAFESMLSIWGEGSKKSDIAKDLWDICQPPGEEMDLTEETVEEHEEIEMYKDRETWEDENLFRQASFTVDRHSATETAPQTWEFEPTDPAQMAMEDQRRTDRAEFDVLRARQRLMDHVSTVIFDAQPSTTLTVPPDFTVFDRPQVSQVENDFQVLIDHTFDGESKAEVAKTLWRQCELDMKDMNETIEWSGWPQEEEGKSWRLLYFWNNNSFRIDCDEESGPFVRYVASRSMKDKRA